MIKTYLKPKLLVFSAAIGTLYIGMLRNVGCDYTTHYLFCVLRELSIPSFSMKILFLVIGKTDETYLDTGINKFIKRLEHYVPFEMKVIPDIKNRKTLSEEQQKKAEGDLILSQLAPGDDLILLDENGKTFSSVAFSQWIEKQMNVGGKRIIFVVGGPYGFSKDVYAKAKFKISLSEMTFSHQMIRLIFVEQLYRAFTIIKGEPYHHV